MHGRSLTKHLQELNLLECLKYLDLREDDI